MSQKSSALKRLWRDNSGIAMVELALTFPILLTLATVGLETTNYATTKMRVGQLALHAADHGSRMGSGAQLKNIQITEADVNDVLVGTGLQGGSIDLLDKGRVIISSLQRNPSGGQWIAWQRCIGNPKFASHFGKQGAGATGTSFLGMGPAGSKIKAQPGEAVMFAEVDYEYEPFFPGFALTGMQLNFYEYATFNVRDDRDITQLYPAAGSPNRLCGA